AGRAELYFPHGCHSCHSVPGLSNRAAGISGEPEHHALDQRQVGVGTAQHALLTPDRRDRAALLPRCQRFSGTARQPPVTRLLRSRKRGSERKESKTGSTPILHSHSARSSTAFSNQTNAWFLSPRPMYTIARLIWATYRRRANSFKAS